MTKACIEDIKVGNIVYWYSENEEIRIDTYEYYPFLRDEYGVVNHISRAHITVFYPKESKSFRFNLLNIYKIEME